MLVKVLSDATGSGTFGRTVIEGIIVYAGGRRARHHQRGLGDAHLPRVAGARLTRSSYTAEGGRRAEARPLNLATRFASSGRDAGRVGGNDADDDENVGT